MPDVGKLGGACRWCAVPIFYPEKHKLAGQPNRRRRWCSVSETSCVHDYLIASNQSDMRKALWRRDRGKCQCCGVYAGRAGWDADHRIPLWKAPEIPSLDDRETYWGLSNLVTMCKLCHTLKTKAEATERATIRRNIKSLAIV